MKNKLKSKFLEWLADESGVTGLEYGLLAGGVGLALVTVIALFSGEFVAMQETITTYMNT